ncbi:MAG: 4-hydroxy-tetrahydrodipicolinate reductase [Paraglaciecola sp.]|uniref:4-hydroxy-tetrahydrodipicolinate reductase n=1 Tax=Pseudomonadati TaxID=3379134 RepID=UPI00273F8AC7|nr:4-hydroxy-tetrahydrodipicolinate reductase [Paraglaciecola sp.]MDP5029131.1 4-hydroxy-tetrahydrodipicolinate reductase [Paraglaciecola sp.]MDP5129416.1 4-hydroxy-tetrahydrodipicolinate reductase [Paraglaciecola sp.]
MSKIAIFGANGRMGRVLVEAIKQDAESHLSAATVRASSSMLGTDVGELSGIGKLGVTTQADLTGSVADIDVMIDFTLPAALTDNLAFCVKHKLPIVIGTTGLNAEQKNALTLAAQSIPIVFAANYSVGVNLLLNLVRQTAKVMGQTADIEIIETHHRYKKDAPSGTAVAIGEAIADELDRDLAQCAVYGREGDTGERDQQTIGFATVRAGDVIGDHTVLFADIGERLEITHKASSRLTFAKGAVKAANWLIKQPAGLYNMADVLGFNAN